MNYYEKSIKELKKIVRQNPKITREEWDQYAHDNVFYSAITIMAHKEVENWESLKKQIQGRW